MANIRTITITDVTQPQINAAFIALTSATKGLEVDVKAVDSAWKSANKDLQKQIDDIKKGTTVYTAGSHIDINSSGVISVVDVDKTFTIKRNGTNLATFTALATSSEIADITVPTKTSEISNDSGFITKDVNDLTNYTLTSALASVATSGAYSDLSGVPTNVSDFNNDAGYITSASLPTVNDGTLTIQQNGTQVATFTANQSGPSTANITVPTKTSELSNDSGFITSSSIPTVNNGTLTIQQNGTQVTTFTANQSGPSTANITVPTKTSELSNDSGFITSSSVPTKTSQLTNDSGFITAASVPTKTSQLTNDSGFLTTSTLPSMRFTYVVDNDTKLSNWASNASGNDYTSVLIRGSITGSNIHINLSTTGTKVIVGEEGSSLTLTNSTTGHTFYYNDAPMNTLSAGGDMSTTDPQACSQMSQEFFISNLSITITYTSGSYSQSIFYNCVNIYNTTVSIITSTYEKYAFWSCVGIYNCFARQTKSGGSYNTTIYNCWNIYNTISIALQTGTSGRAWAFEQCRNLYGCFGIAKGDCSDEGSIGFRSCHMLWGCQGVGQVRTNSSRYGYGFTKCYKVMFCGALQHCHNSVFSDCYASNTAVSTYAVADTANGGFNNTTNP